MLQERRMSKGTLLAAIALTGALAAATAPAVAQSYPIRPITLIVPFPPGGSTTIVARIIGEKMSETLGQPIVIDNRGGAGGTVGTRSAAKSAPDGYTIALTYTGTMAIGPSIQVNAGYDPRQDFVPIGRIGSAPMVVVVHPSVKATSIADLIKLIASDPVPAQYGTAGVGTVGHLAGELFASMAKVKMAHIPYKGSGPMVTDLLGGHVKISFTNIPVAHGNVTAGTLRALAVASAHRSSLMPDIPTVAESGLPGYEAGLLYGLAAPAGTPKPIVDRLNKELRTALASAEVRKRLATEGAEPLPSSPEEYAVDIDREETLWSKLIESIGLKGK
jgi:tripartite-type tricarboxylate transporter receptor subunit TctC